MASVGSCHSPLTLFPLPAIDRYWRLQVVPAHCSHSPHHHHHQRPWAVPACHCQHRCWCLQAVPTHCHGAPQSLEAPVIHDFPPWTVCCSALRGAYFSAFSHLLIHGNMTVSSTPAGTLKLTQGHWWQIGRLAFLLRDLHRLIHLSIFCYHCHPSYQARGSDRPQLCD